MTELLPRLGRNRKKQKYGEEDQVDHALKHRRPPDNQGYHAEQQGQHEEDLIFRAQAERLLRRDVKCIDGRKWPHRFFTPQ